MITPTWSVVPPNAPGAAPAVVVNVDPPVPPPPAKLFGVAQWMKTYKTENVRQVNLDELVADNPVVPEDPSRSKQSGNSSGECSGSGRKTAAEEGIRGRRQSCSSPPV